jgi:hypothetical protein
VASSLTNIARRDEASLSGRPPVRAAILQPSSECDRDDHGSQPLGFATFLISTRLFYGPPLPVQPMKAVSAVIGWEPES